MYSSKILSTFLPKLCKINVGTYVPQRNVQVSIIGAAGEVGANVALLVKQNLKVKKLQLYDDNEKVIGIGYELNHISGGPPVFTYAGDSCLGTAIQLSDLVVMVARIPRKPGNTRYQMIGANAPGVLRLCRAMADKNNHALFAIATNPVNSLLPFATALMFKYGCYNPFKLFGVTNIDSARSRAYAASVLGVSARDLYVPVIGGHSDETTVPLYSNLTPSQFQLDACQGETLTRLVRKAGTEVVNHKDGTESATLAVAWAINEFIEALVDAILGNEVMVHCYTANPHYGTRFFSGPTKIGQDGIIQTSRDLPMSDHENYLLNCSIPVLNQEVIHGEEFVQYIENARRK
ncbi:hypothetical protein O3G_MSEX006734 [Manduca sexta]|uniref:Malate dehydrogenase, mitochondrial n=1 Tax=Manduca sexta TaxID=7130 RepID=A0A922CKV9_MANSE|nr:hypothetical protein O3G_MSEX006734 [Manduca sexta]